MVVPIFTASTIFKASRARQRQERLSDKQLPLPEAAGTRFETKKFANFFERSYKVCMGLYRGYMWGSMVLSIED